MDTGNEAIAILHDAERSLRDLIQKRLAEQRYGEVASIARLADGLSQLTHRSSESPSPPGRGESEGDPPMPVINRSARLATETPRRPKPPKKKEYPKFVREGDRLVKIGWSKKYGEEYEHRAPLVVATALLAEIRRKVRDGEPFAATDIIPFRIGDDVMPDYQAYLALKWFQSEGIVTKLPRDRYSVEPGRIGPIGLDQYWQRLPTSKSGGSK